MPFTPTQCPCWSAPLLLLCQLYLQLTCLPCSLGPHPHRSLGLSSPSPPTLCDSPAVYLPTPLPFPLQEWPGQLLECLVRNHHSADPL